MSELEDLQQKIMTLQDMNDLQQVSQIFLIQHILYKGHGNGLDRRNDIVSVIVLAI